MIIGIVFCCFWVSWGIYLLLSLTFSNSPKGWTQLILDLLVIICGTTAAIINIRTGCKQLAEEQKKALNSHTAE